MPRAGQSMHLVPVFGSIMAFVLLGESLHFYHLAGVAMIGSGILLAQQTARVKKPALVDVAPPPSPSWREQAATGRAVVSAAGARAPAPE